MKARVSPDAGNDNEEVREMNSLNGEVKKDRRMIFVIALILGLVLLYIIDAVILTWRL